MKKDVCRSHEQCTDPTGSALVLLKRTSQKKRKKKKKKNEDVDAR